MTWSGQWVADRLAARLVTESAGPLRLPELVGIAVRRNPRRAHLLVSTVLGKHLPCDPRLVYGAGRLLGAQAADALAGTGSGIADEGGQLLATALDGDLAAATKLLSLCDQHAALVRTNAVVVGFAETATALGHSVADALVAPYLHSTRRDDGGARAAMFVEEHSHATDHLLLPADPQLLRRPGPLVLVDDELSTGQTALNTIRALHSAAPARARYLIASLVDLRSSADRARMAELAIELAVEIEVISLAAGRLELPRDVLERGLALVAAQPTPVASQTDTAEPGTWPVLDWPAGVNADGRHGFYPAERDGLSAAAMRCADVLAAQLRQSGARRVLVLGSEELMYAPLRIAMALADLLDVEVRFSTTTRSPILTVDDAAYPIRSRLEFPAHDDPVDGPGARYAYNITATEPFTDTVLVIDEVGETESLRVPGGLCNQLARLTSLRLVRIPAGGRTGQLPEPLLGPAFGSYPAAEVSWLLTDLSGLRLEAPTEDREEAIQTGEAHYAESLPIEFQPSDEYQSLFAQALDASAAKVAQAVGTVTELILTERGPDVVLASLARAGTPIGILMRRWAEQLYGLRLPHYALSIVRGRGIDTVALRYLAAHHDPTKVVFVDGWTGKGAIARELAAAIAEANQVLGTAFCSELAVLADTGSCVRTFGTRSDYLIPSACLNSTVSGLVSRTVLNDSLIGPNQFHGAKFYAELSGGDVSNEFLDAVSARYDEVRDEVHSAAPALDRDPTWAGWRAVQELSVRHGINDVNLVKPGVGETTRVLLRRVPWKVLMRRDAAAELGHLRLLAAQRGVLVELVDELAYSCVGLIRPGFKRGVSMTGTVLVAADLDRTLIYSKAALQLGPGQQPRLRCVESLEGKQSSFMTETAASALFELAESAVLMPVTTRTLKQLNRVTLPARTRFSIAANGGMLFVDGELDRAWRRQVRRAVAEVAPLDQVWARVNERCSPDWTLKLRTASSLFCYAVIDRPMMPPGFIDEMTAWAGDLGWSTSLQGRKLYWVPQPLTKSAAVAEVARRIGADLVLAAGDSLLDADLLLAADRGIQPRHGELSESGWSAPHVGCTEAAGVMAGEEICLWFLQQLTARRAA